MSTVQQTNRIDTTKLCSLFDIIDLLWNKPSKKHSSMWRTCLQNVQLLLDSQSWAERVVKWSETWILWSFQAGDWRGEQNKAAKPSKNGLEDEVGCLEKVGKDG